MEDNNEKALTNTGEPSQIKEEVEDSSYNKIGTGVKESLTDWISSPLDYTGRTARKPFWIVQIFLCVINVVALVPLLYYSMIPSSGARFDHIMILVWLVFFAANILLLFVNIPLTVRRVRDTGLTPFLVLLIIVPFFGHAIVLVLCALSTDAVKMNHS